MKKNTLWFLVFLTSINLFAQTNRIDSLSYALEKSKDSLDQILILNRLSIAYYYDNPQKAKEFALKGLEIAQAIDNKTEQGRLLNTLGLMFYSMYELEKSREYFLEALDLQEEVEDLEGVSITLGNIGLTYYVAGDYPKAITYYLEGLKMEEQLGQEEKIIGSYINIALVWLDLKDYQKAEQYFTMALDIARKLRKKEMIMIVATNLSLNYIYKKDWDRALNYADTVLHYARELNVRFGIGKAKSATARVYYERQNYDQALIELTIAKNVYKELGYEREYIACQLDEAEIQVKLNRLNEAQSITSEILPVLHNLRDPEALQDIYNLLGQIYSRQGRWKQAHQAQESFMSYKDSLLNQDKIKEIARLQIQYETEKKEQEIEGLAQQATIQSLKLKQSNLTLTILGIAIIVLLLAGLVLYLMNRQKQLALKQRAQNIEQNLLRVQMNPHFIFNAMTAIQDYMNQGDAKQAGIYLIKFSKLIRQVLNNSRSEFINLDQEINMLENYLMLQNLRRDRPFNFTIELEEGLVSDEIAIPPMFAQPFVENAIEHGVVQTDINANIHIYFSLENDYLLLRVSDNGDGMEESTKVKREGHVSYAKQITKERIDLYRQMTKKKIAFDIQNLSPGLQVTFNLPYQYI